MVAALPFLPWFAIVISILLFSFCFCLIKKQQRKINAIELLTKSLLLSNAKFKKEFSEIPTGAVGMGRKVQKLDGEIKSTLENQQNLAAQAPENRLYTRSMKMVELGASIEEIIE